MEQVNRTQMAEQEVGKGVGGEHYTDAYIMEKDSRDRRINFMVWSGIIFNFKQHSPSSETPMCHFFARHQN